MTMLVFICYYYVHVVSHTFKLDGSNETVEGHTFHRCFLGVSKNGTLTAGHENCTQTVQTRTSSHTISSAIRNPKNSAQKCAHNIRDQQKENVFPISILLNGKIDFDIGTHKQKNGNRSGATRLACDGKFLAYLHVTFHTAALLSTTERLL